MTKLAITLVVPGIEFISENHLCHPIEFKKLFCCCLTNSNNDYLLTCIDVEVKKPSSKIMGTDEVYVEQ